MGVDVGEDLYCGPKSLVIAAARVGLDLSLDQVIEDCSIDPQVGTSMLNLKRVAENRGLEVTACLLTVDTLIEQDCPAILWVNNRHFCVVDAPGKAGSEAPLKIYNYRGIPLITPSELEEIWKGEALLISRQMPDHLEEGAFVYFGEILHDFGYVTSGKTYSHEFALRNLGMENVNVLKVTTDCQCIKTEFSSKVIAPGKTASVALSFTPGTEEGYQTASAWIFTNDRESTPHRITIAANTSGKNFFISPRKIDFGVSPSGVR